VQVDHVVALSDAWQKGAQPWNLEQRTAFANDPLNLLAIDGPSNASKAAGDAATWLPPSKPYRCSYVARQVAVKVKYEVWVTAAEREAIARILGTCLEQTLPTSSPIPLGPPTRSPPLGCQTASSGPPSARSCARAASCWPVARVR